MSEHPTQMQYTYAEILDTSSLSSSDPAKKLELNQE